jgi:hypothetical protein
MVDVRDVLNDDAEVQCVGRTFIRGNARDVEAFMEKNAVVLEVYRTDALTHAAPEGTRIPDESEVAGALFGPYDSDAETATSSFYRRVDQFHLTEEEQQQWNHQLSGQGHHHVPAYFASMLVARLPASSSSLASSSSASASSSTIFESFAQEAVLFFDHPRQVVRFLKTLPCFLRRKDFVWWRNGIRAIPILAVDAQTTTEVVPSFDPVLTSLKPAPPSSFAMKRDMQDLIVCAKEQRITGSQFAERMAEWIRPCLPFDIQVPFVVPSVSYSASRAATDDILEKRKQAKDKSKEASSVTWPNTPLTGYVDVFIEEINSSPTLTTDDKVQLVALVRNFERVIVQQVLDHFEAMQLRLSSRWHDWTERGRES